MDERLRDRRWLSLKQASKLLGIHPVTLRIWADTGKIPCTRTPGGHRRFAEEDIKAFFESDSSRAEASDVELKVQNSLERARWEMSKIGMKAENWYDVFDQAGRHREREIGQRLLTLLVLYATGEQEEPGPSESGMLHEACEIGGQMGRYTAEVGLSLAETLRVFLMFESSAIDAAVPALARPGRIDEHDIQVHARAHAFMREVLFALLEVYQGSVRGRANDGPAGNGSMRRQPRS